MRDLIGMADHERKRRDEEWAMGGTCEMCKCDIKPSDRSGHRRGAFLCGPCLSDVGSAGDGR